MKDFTASLATFSAALSLISLSACATKPPTQTGFLSDAGSAQPDLDRNADGIRAQVRKSRDMAVLGQVAQSGKVAILPSTIHPDSQIPASITPASRLLVTQELDKQLCFHLSRRFEIVAPESPGAARVQAVVTRLQETNAAASVASSAVSFLLPGGSVRLPVGRGGLSVEARLDSVDGARGASMAWSRGAGVVMDDGSLSQVGDAHRFTKDFANAFSTFLVADGTPKRDIAKPDPCAQFGPRLDVARLAAGGVSGLHIVGKQKEATPSKP
jgi:hypothetical protein